ncbi:MAG: site-specific integrase [Planctomycetes bacterium]|nr:site-specific integrase [Planctomycetota bacterium]
MNGTRKTPQINAFLHYLEVEAGLSSHTLNAYRNDLTLFSSFLSAKGHSTFDLKRQRAHFRFFKQ